MYLNMLMKMEKNTKLMTPLSMLIKLEVRHQAYAIVVITVQYMWPIPSAVIVVVVKSVNVLSSSSQNTFVLS